jgi:hypothetical protein
VEIKIGSDSSPVSGPAEEGHYVIPAFLVIGKASLAFCLKAMPPHGTERGCWSSEKLAHDFGATFMKVPPKMVFGKYFEVRCIKAGVAHGSIVKPAWPKEIYDHNKEIHTKGISANRVFQFVIDWLSDVALGRRRASRACSYNRSPVRTGATKVLSPNAWSLYWAGFVGRLTDNLNKTPCELLIILQCYQQIEQIGDIILNDAPQSIIIDTEIAVDQSISRGDDHPPWDFRMFFPDHLWDVCRRFTDQLEVS